MEDERIKVGSSGDAGVHRYMNSVPQMVGRAQQDGGIPRSGPLQSRSHLARLHRAHPLVVGVGGHEDRWIGFPLLDVVIG